MEFGLVEKRHAALREVLEGATAVYVARRNGVARQTVHEWLRRYAVGGMRGWWTGRRSRQGARTFRSRSVGGYRNLMG